MHQNPLGPFTSEVDVCVYVSRAQSSSPRAFSIRGRCARLRGSGAIIFLSGLLHPRSVCAFTWVGRNHLPLGPFKSRGWCLRLRGSGCSHQILGPLYIRGWMKAFEWVGRGHLPLGPFAESGACVSVGRAHAPGWRCLYKSEVKVKSRTGGTVRLFLCVPGMGIISRVQVPNAA